MLPPLPVSGDGPAQDEGGEWIDGRDGRDTRDLSSGDVWVEARYGGESRGRSSEGLRSGAWSDGRTGRWRGDTNSFLIPTDIGGSGGGGKWFRGDKDCFPSRFRSSPCRRGGASFGRVESFSSTTFFTVVRSRLGDPSVKGYFHACSAMSGRSGAR